MTDTQDDFFIGVMLLKDGKWSPPAKFGENAFGSALIKAEELNGNTEYDGIKIMKIPTSKESGNASKEMWISPHFANKAEAAAAAKLSKGQKQTQKKMLDVHAQRKAEFRNKK